MCLAVALALAMPTVGWAQPARPSSRRSSSKLQRPQSRPGFWQSWSEHMYAPAQRANEGLNGRINATRDESHEAMTPSLQLPPLGSSY
jgi:hypothetical protein